jgi:hypothetical protein
MDYDSPSKNDTRKGEPARAYRRRKMKEVDKTRYNLIKAAGVIADVVVLKYTPAKED